MIKDTPKDGKLREMIFKFWYKRYFDPNYEHSDMVIFINSVLLVIKFNKPKNYWERIIKSPGGIEALCDRLVRAADKCKNLEDRVTRIINCIMGGDRLRILPMSVAPKRRVFCYLCRWCDECKRGRNREQKGSWLCDECNARKTFFDSMDRLPSLVDPSECVVVRFAGDYRACDRCGGLVY